MPVSFVSDQQKQAYGAYLGDPSPEQLARFFFLDDTDVEVISRCRGDHNRLGFALLLCTARFLGTFPVEISTVPSSVITYVSRQLQISNPKTCLVEYENSDQRSYRRHTSEIRSLYGFTEFADASAQFRIMRWLYGLCWTGTDRPSTLFDRATDWLLSHKVLLPGISVLERLIARIRKHAQERVWRLLSSELTEIQKRSLDSLLLIEEGETKTLLDVLRHGPKRRSARELARALDRLERIRGLGITLSIPKRLPRSKLQELSRFATTAKCAAIERFPESRRYATLAAFIDTVEASATDDVLDLFDVVMTEKISDAQKESRKLRLRSLKDLDDAAIVLRNAVAIMLNPELPETEVRSTVLATVTRSQLDEAIQQVDNISEPMEDTNFKLLTEQYRSVRLFLPKLLELVEFQAGPTGGALVEALEYLKAMEIGKPKTPPPTEIVPKALRKDIVDENGKTNRPAFTLCTLSKLRTSQRRREVFVNPSHRFGDPTSGLLKDAAWDAARPTICRTLNLPSQAELAITTLRDNLHAAFTTVANNFSSNSAVRFELVNGKQELVVSPLDKVEEPESLVALRALVDAKLPRVDLPEVIMEIAARTGFVEEFVHINGNEPRVPDLEISVCALLVAEACNTGIEPIVRNDIPALRRGRLLWVDQNYLRNETITAANARLVAAQNHIPLVKSWGSGDVASADGVRFVVPVSTVHAGPNPKYFGKGRGITYYNLMSDQFTGTNAIVVPGTLHDALSLLTIVLEQPTELNPTEIITDTGAYTDLIFGLFWSLGYQFSPRLADVGGARLWRIEQAADYGSLNSLCRDRINLDLIRQNWDDMLRLAGSLKMGLVHPGSVIRNLQASDRQTPLARAISECGRISKTLHILSILDDETKRRSLLIQLNRHEGRNKLARTVFHARKGEVRQHYRQGQEDQLGALGLVVNIIILWNTIYMDAAIAELENEGHVIDPADKARLSPLGSEHINMLGRYSFAIPESVARGELRPLRDPSASLDEL